MQQDKSCDHGAERLSAPVAMAREQGSQSDDDDEQHVAKGVGVDAPLSGPPDARMPARAVLEAQQ